MVTSFCINCKHSVKISGNFEQIYCTNYSKGKALFPKMYVDDVCKKYEEKELC